MTFLLDTDHNSIIQRGGESAEIITARLRLVSPDDYGTSIVSFQEQVEGWLAKINQAASLETEVEYYARLYGILRFYNNLAVWQYTSDAASRFKELKAAKVRVGTQDLKIASIALANDATVLTRNTRDFGKVPGLKVEDWTI